MYVILHLKLATSVENTLVVSVFMAISEDSNEGATGSSALTLVNLPIVLNLH